MTSSPGKTNSSLPLKCTCHGSLENSWMYIDNAVHACTIISLPRNALIFSQRISSLPTPPGSCDPATLVVAHICRSGDLPAHCTEVWWYDVVYISLLEHSSYVRNVVYVLTHTHSSRVRMEYLQSKTRINVRIMMQYVYRLYNLRVMQNI